MLARPEPLMSRRPAGRSPAASPRRRRAAAAPRPRHPRRRHGGSRRAARAGAPEPTARPGLSRSPPSRIGSEAPPRLSAISCGLTSSPLATSSATIIAIVCKISTSSSVYCRRVRFCTTSTPSTRLAAQDRHAHQRMVDLLAGFRAIGEIGVGLRVGQRQRARGGRDPPDETLADPAAGCDAPPRGATPRSRTARAPRRRASHRPSRPRRPFRRRPRGRSGRAVPGAASEPAMMPRRRRSSRRVVETGSAGACGARSRPGPRRGVPDDLAHSETAPAETPAEHSGTPAGGCVRPRNRAWRAAITASA